MSGRQGQRCDAEPDPYSAAVCSCQGRKGLYGAGDVRAAPKERLSTPEIMGYYLYSTTFCRKDREYVDYVEERIRDLQRRQPEVWLFQWILLYLDEQLLRHAGEKTGSHPQTVPVGDAAAGFVYLEAAQVLERSPLLLRRLDAFDIQVLHFMCREDLMNAELVMQLAELTGRAGSFGSGAV